MDDIFRFAGKVGCCKKIAESKETLGPVPMETTFYRLPEPVTLQRGDEPPEVIHGVILCPECVEECDRNIEKSLSKVWLICDWGGKVSLN